VEVNSTGGQGSRRAVAPSDDRNIAIAAFAMRFVYRDKALCGHDTHNARTY
jgi:hypothetical protein